MPQNLNFIMIYRGDDLPLELAQVLDGWRDIRWVAVVPSGMPNPFILGEISRNNEILASANITIGEDKIHVFYKR